MKNPTRETLLMEFGIQLLLMIPMVLCYLSSNMIFALIFEFFLGSFQCFSALLKVFKFNSNIRKGYLAVSFIYILLLFFAEIRDFVVIPFSLSLFYLGLTVLQANGKYLEPEPINMKNLDLDEIEDPDLIIDKISDNHKKRSES